MRAFKKVAVGVALACGVLPLMAGPASADVSPPAYLQRTMYLTHTPSDANAVACLSRTIYLATGDYQGLATLDSMQSFLGNYIVSAPGNYSWSACLNPHNGGYYTISMVLYSSAGGMVVNAVSQHYVIPFSGTMTWGDILLHV